MKENEFDDRPWTEEEWEKFIECSEIRAAKYGELLETFMDDPNCDEIIAREMGWDEPDDEGTAADVEWMNSIAEAAVHDEEIEEFIRRREEGLRALPAYARSFEFGLKCHNLLRPYVQAEADPPDDDLIAAFSESRLIAVKIAGGHAMGYEDHTLCGNIVCCKRSLAAADKCLAALESLKARGKVPSEVLDPLIAACREVRSVVEQHIAELRSRVWWV
ncbi:MAG: hypothetical protein NZT92_07855 [Abditibacteriales bacterium]|nr:hypothetical protein [Abditibacteriales bacterium]MDW8366535.1 hypothetical protein [Abditibacteriales bacterium]